MSDQQKENFYDHLDELLPRAVAQMREVAREKAMKAGVPFIFNEADGKTFKEYPDGHIVEIVDGKETPYER